MFVATCSFLAEPDDMQTPIDDVGERGTCVSCVALLNTDSIPEATSNLPLSYNGARVERVSIAAYALRCLHAHKSLIDLHW